MRTSIAGLTFLIFAASCGGDDDGATPDAGAPDAGGQFAGVDEGSWAWVDVPGSKCMDGSATGIGVNLNRASSKLAIVFEGGGACFNVVSCSGVAHQDGFGQAELGAFAADYGGKGIFDRTDAANPLADWNYIFVPYCTGDIHAGNNPAGFGNRKQVGYVNSTNAAELAQAEFAGSVDQVLVAGQSAGGFGAAYNYDQIATRFAGVSVDLLDDSGPPLSATYLTPCFESQIRDLWSLDSTLPAGCTACAEGGIGTLVDYYSATYADARQGYIQSYRDDTISYFFGFGYPDCANPVVPMVAATFQEAVIELRDDIVGPLANAAMFTLDSEVHVWTVGTPLADIVVGDDNLGAWIAGLVGHTAGWDNVVPPPL